MNVVILGSNYMTRLCLIRSICEAIDCEITVVDMLYDSPKKMRMLPLDFYSKYVKRHLYAQKFQDEALCELLLRECSVEGKKPFLLSVDDDSACLIDKNLDLLQQHFLCANINGEQGRLACLMDKQKQKELARKFGFNTVKSWVIECVDNKYIIPDDIEFPCFIKGLLSYHTMKVFQGRYDSRDELEKSLQEISKKLTYPFIAEEFIDIDKDLGVIGFCDGENCVTPGVVELLESGHGNHHGVSAFGLVRKEKKDEDVLQKVSELVKTLGLFGLFNFDLVESGGKIYFVELNLRFAAYGYAVTKAGVNLPEMFIKSGMGAPVRYPNKDVIKESYYINERVALDDVVGGYRSFHDFRRLQQKASFGLMKDEKDKRPYRQLKKQFVILYIYRRIKFLLGK